MSAVEIRDYDPSHSDACLAVERRCPQGSPIRIRFERPTFHARAQAYEEWHIAVACEGDTVVGAAASAKKRVHIHGEPASAAFYFDGRVVPEHRNLWVARALLKHLLDKHADADLHYTHTFGSNVAAAAVMKSLGFASAAQLEILARPVPRASWRSDGGPAVRETSLDDVCGRYLERHGPRELVVDPRGTDSDAGLIACLAGAEASCGVWSNHSRFEELVEQMPASLNAARWVCDRWPLSALPTPRLPRPGSALRSWFVFALAAPDGRAAASLLREVEARARAADVDCLYIVGDRSLPWFSDLQRARSRWLSATLPVDLRVRSRARKLPPQMTYTLDVRDL